MDDSIVEIIAVIMGLLWFFFAKGKGQKKEATEHSTERPASDGPTSAKKSGLQERLEAALQEMQQRVEGESTQARSEPNRTSPAEERLSEGASKEFDPTWANVSEVDFSSRLDKVAVEEEYQSADRFSGFKEAHGLHYGEEPLLDENASGPEFREAHGIHYGNDPTHKHPAPVREVPVPPFFQDGNELRRAVVMAEVLGKPKALQR